MHNKFWGGKKTGKGFPYWHSERRTDRQSDVNSTLQVMLKCTQNTLRIDCNEASRIASLDVYENLTSLALYFHCMDQLSNEQNHVRRLIRSFIHFKYLYPILSSHNQTTDLIIIIIITKKQQAYINAKVNGTQRWWLKKGTAARTPETEISKEERHSVIFLAF